MNTVLNELKERFNNPIDAYKYLAMFHEYSTVFLTNSNNPLVKEYNDFSLYLNNAKNNKIVLKSSGYLDTDRKREIVKAICDDIGIGHNTLIDLICNSTKGKIEKLSNNFTWESVELYINSHSINNIVLEQDNSIIDEIVSYLDKNNIQGIHLKTTQGLKEVFENFKKSAEELSKVTNIPLNRLFGDTKISIDSVKIENASAWYYSNCDMLCFKNTTFNGTLAHEWLHSYDYKVGRTIKNNKGIKSNEFFSVSEDITDKTLDEFGLIETKKILGLFSEKNKVNEIKYQSHVAELNKNINTNVIAIYDRFLSKYGNQKTKEKLLSLLDESNGGDISFKDELAGLLTDDAPKHYLGFMQNEFATIKKISVDSFRETNLFNFYAKEADNHLDKEWHGYTSSKVEMLARSFEVYIKEISKNPQLLTDANESFLYPRGYEKEIYKNQWSKVIKEMSEFLGDVYLDNSIETNIGSMSIEGVKDKLNGFRKTSAVNNIKKLGVT